MSLFSRHAVSTNLNLEEGVITFHIVLFLFCRIWAPDNTAATTRNATIYTGAEIMSLEWEYKTDRLVPPSAAHALYNNIGIESLLDQSYFSSI